MEAIEVVFNARIKELEFPKIISFDDTTPEYKNIKLVPVDKDNYLYEIRVKKNLSNSANRKVELLSVIREATTEAQKFVYVFSFVSNTKIIEFNCKGCLSNGNLSSLQTPIGNVPLLQLEVNERIEVGEQSIQGFKQKMKQNHDFRKLQLFYDSATIQEPIGRFVSLYTLLLHYCDDRQQNLDKAILSIDSTVAQYKSPQGEHHETLFTKLRNELAHKRDGVNFIETQQFVQENVDRLEFIVKSYLF